MADDSDLYSMLMGDEPTAQEKALAMAQALRGQRRQADVQQQYGLLGQLSGDKVLGGVGKSLLGAAQGGYERADSGQKQLSQVAETRLQRALQAQQMAQQKAQHDAQLGEQTTYHAGELDLKRRALDQGQWTPFNGKDGEVLEVNHRTGQTRLLGQASPEQMTRGGAGGVQQEREWMKLVDKLDPTKGENLQNQKRINAAGRLKQLFQDPAGGAEAVRNLDQREMEELAMGMQNLVSPGGHSAGEVAGLVPHSIVGNGQKTLEWLLNEPRGANQQAFVQKMAHTVDREEAAARDSLRKSQYAVLPGFSNLSKADRKRFEGVLRGQNLDPSNLDDSLVFRGAPQGGGERQVVKKQHNRALGKTRVTYADGTTEVLDGLQ